MEKKLTPSRRLTAVSLLIILSLVLPACNVSKLIPQRPQAQATSSPMSARSVAQTPGPVAETPRPANALTIPAISDPKTLAENVVKAAGPEARYQALLAVMRALKLGVYEPQTGKAILRGTERGPKDFYLYDIELKGMASALSRKATWDTAYLADFFNRAGFQANGQPVNPAALRQMLLTAVRSSSAAPSDPYSLVHLVVREMGLRHDVPYDMQEEVPQAQLQFDALQLFLIQADVLVPLIRERAALAKRSGPLPGMNIPQAQPVAYSLAAAPCEGMVGLDGISPFAKYLLGLHPAADVTILILDMIHGEMLAYSVQVKALGDGKTQTTHYGHESPGKELRFQIKVEMLDDYGEALVNCLALAGYQIPKQGPIPGVGIMWDTGGLDDHGTLSYDPTSGKTNDDGIATLIYKPKKENRPKQGPIVEERGTVMGLALYQSAFGNIPGTVAQFLTPKTSDPMAWTVERHKNFSLEVALNGSISVEEIKWTFDGNKVTIPLEGTGGEWKGEASPVFNATLSGLDECSGSATYPTSLDVTATGSDPLNFKIIGNFVPAISIVCDDEGGGDVSMSATSKQPLTFSLPAKDGESKAFPFGDNGAWTFTLKEQ